MFSKRMMTGRRFSSGLDRLEDAKGNGPDWLVTDRVLRAFELAQDGRGRRAYVAWLEARAANDRGKIDEEAMRALLRGGYLGKETFKDRLLKLFDPSSGNEVERTGANPLPR